MEIRELQLLVGFLAILSVILTLVIVFLLVLYKKAVVQKKLSSRQYREGILIAFVIFWVSIILIGRFILAVVWL